ncbi:hypothetical protein Tco_0374421 [Tanacetum coccineum]
MNEDECVKGRMPTKIEQHWNNPTKGVSNDVLGYIKMEMVMPHSSWSRILLPQCSCSYLTKTIFRSSQDSRIMKAHELKSKDFRAKSVIRKITPLKSSLRGRLLASFQDDASMQLLVKTDIDRRHEGNKPTTNSETKTTDLNGQKQSH